MSEFTQTDRYAVFGHPISQSKSPKIHLAFATQTKQNLLYEKILGNLDNFSASLDDFFDDANAKGCNVTAPFKQDAAKWVTELSAAAKAAGAVNTISRLANGGFRGDTTDGQGLIVDLENQGVNLSTASLLLIGAGGAARGIVLPLLEKGVARIDVVNRTAQKAMALSKWFDDDRITGKSFAQVNSENEQYDLIVNCTSASLNQQLPELADAVIAQASMVYDMVYLSNDTVFIAKAKQLGVTKTSDGLGMLVGQAAYSFYLWRGVMPKLSPVLDMLRAEL
jgi:shikimate dehydrogenase